MLRTILKLATVVLALSSASTSASDEALVRQLSARFESARSRGDLKTARELLAVDATNYALAGGDNRSLLYDLAVSARRLAASDRDQLEPVRVISRDVEVRGEVAIVTELMGATAVVEPAEKIAPRRRTAVWVKEMDDWKLSHLHTSGYTLWERAVQSFEAADQKKAPAANGVVFVGSSSIVGWRSLAEDFPSVVTTRRGFGGSDIIDSVAYAHRIVTPYRPRRIALYAGDNDIARGKTAERVFEDYKLFVETVHAVLPQTHIGFIAIKPSLARWKLWPRMKTANQTIQQYAASNPQLEFLDIATPMLGADAMPLKHLFAQDGLHLSADGYALWTKAMAHWVNAAP